MTAKEIKELPQEQRTFISPHWEIAHQLAAIAEKLTLLTDYFTQHKR